MNENGDNDDRVIMNNKNAEDVHLKKVRQSALFSDLPPEIVSHIASLCTLKDRLQLRTMNKSISKAVISAKSFQQMKSVMLISDSEHGATTTYEFVDGQTNYKHTCVHLDGRPCTVPWTCFLRLSVIGVHRCLLMMPLSQRAQDNLLGLVSRNSVKSEHQLDTLDISILLMRNFADLAHYQYYTRLLNAASANRRPEPKLNIGAITLDFQTGGEDQIDHPFAVQAVEDYSRHLQLYGIESLLMDLYEQSQAVSVIDCGLYVNKLSVCTPKVSLSYFSMSRSQTLAAAVNTFEWLNLDSVTCLRIILTPTAPLTFSRFLDAVESFAIQNLRLLHVTIDQAPDSTAFLNARMIRSVRRLFRRFPELSDLRLVVSSLFVINQPLQYSTDLINVIWADTRNNTDPTSTYTRLVAFTIPNVQPFTVLNHWVEARSTVHYTNYAHPDADTAILMDDGQIKISHGSITLLFTVLSGNQ